MSAKNSRNATEEATVKPTGMQTQLTAMQAHLGLCMGMAGDMEAQLEAVKQEKACLGEKVAKLEKRIEKMEKVEHRLKQRTEMAEQHRDTCRGVVKQLKEKLRVCEESRKAESLEKDRELQRLTLELDRRTQQLRKTDELLQVRTREAQVHLKTEDTEPHPDIDIVRLVKNLNAVTFEASGQIVALPCFEDNRGELSDLLLESCEVVTGYVGEDMKNILAYSTHKEKSVAVRLALQALFSQMACRAVETWDGCCNESTDLLLETIYKRIVASGKAPLLVG